MQTMEIKTIIRKTHLEVDEICYVIQEYIKDRKGVDVVVSPELTKKIKIWGFRVQQVPNPFAREELKLMHKAYDIACAWFFKEGY